MVGNTSKTENGIKYINWLPGKYYCYSNHSCRPENIQHPEFNLTPRGDISIEHICHPGEDYNAPFAPILYGVIAMVCLLVTIIILSVCGCLNCFSKKRLKKKDLSKNN